MYTIVLSIENDSFEKKIENREGVGKVHFSLFLKKLKVNVLKKYLN